MPSDTLSTVLRAVRLTGAVFFSVDASAPWAADAPAAREIGPCIMLAERFAQLVGVPPIQYLAQWRMQLAATLLSTTTMSLAEIAEQIGYGSEAAFSKAYKRAVGVAPAEWRRGKRDAAA